ncbi:MAG: hypothetical protein WBP56_04855 [Polyangia bacterium]|jgi:hypothetical protein
MQIAEHRRDDSRLVQVVMANDSRHAPSDPLMGSSLIEVDLVLPNPRAQAPGAEEGNWDLVGNDTTRR